MKCLWIAVVSLVICAECQAVDYTAAQVAAAMSTASQMKSDAQALHAEANEIEIIVPNTNDTLSYRPLTSFYVGECWDQYVMRRTYLDERHWDVGDSRELDANEAAQILIGHWFEDADPNGPNYNPLIQIWQTAKGNGDTAVSAGDSLYGNAYSFSMMAMFSSGYQQQSYLNQAYQKAIEAQYQYSYAYNYYGDELWYKDEGLTEYNTIFTNLFDGYEWAE